MVSGKTMILGMMGIACSLLMACSSKQQDCLGERNAGYCRESSVAYGGFDSV